MTMLRDVTHFSPVLVDIFGAARFAERREDLLKWAQKDPRLLVVPRKGHSRGFWNTVADRKSVV
jgi:hypothetical protein